MNRRPWAAALIALFFSPVVGMLYLGRGRWGLAYLLVYLAAYCLLVVAAHFGVLPLPLAEASGYIPLTVNVAGAVHCYRTARRLDQSMPKKWFARWYGLLAVWLSPVVLAFLLRFFLWEPFFIPAASMEPTLHVGDHLFVSKFAYRMSEPRRGDLVIFRTPQDNRTAYVKRLVGLPGDQLQMQQGSLYLNGERLRREEAEGPRSPEGRGVFYREFLPDGRSYLLRELSDDSRYDNTDVYEVPPGQYFFLGDNRDNSLDSRMVIGFVPRENLIGPVSLVFWNGERQKLRFDLPE